MEKTNKKNNKLIQKNKSVITDDTNQVITVKKRGRPKGTKNKTVRSDHAITTQPGENAKMLEYSVTLSELPKIDINNIEQVKQRIKDYYNITIQFDSKPSIACFALAFGVSRISLFNWITGKAQVIKNHECINAIKSVYDIITAQYEQMMNTGKINPVSGIFLMKNNYGYRDQTEYTISTNQENNDTVQDITNRANLLQD